MCSRATSKHYTQILMCFREAIISWGRFRTETFHRDLRVLVLPSFRPRRPCGGSVGFTGWFVCTTFFFRMLCWRIVVKYFVPYPLLRDTKFWSSAQIHNLYVSLFDIVCGPNVCFVQLLVLVASTPIPTEGSTIGEISNGGNNCGYTVFHLIKNLEGYS